MSVVVEPLHIFDEETELIRPDNFLVGHFKAIDDEDVGFGKPIIRVFKVFGINEDEEDYYSIETFTELGIWKENTVEGDVDIPHPFVQHIPCLVLDHMPEGPVELVDSDEFLSHLSSHFIRVYIAHERHYIAGNLPFPEGFLYAFYVAHKFEPDESGNLIKVLIDVDDFPMTEQQTFFRFSTHGVKGTLQAANMVRTLFEEAHLTKMLSYLLFRVEIRNKILSELEKLSHKKYLGHNKFSVSFFCCSNLAGVFLNEEVFSGLSFTSEPFDGTVTKNIVNMGIDQSKVLRYQGKTCPVSVRVMDITAIEHLLGKNFNVHVIKPPTFRTGAMRHFHVVAIKPTNPMLIFSYCCNSHKFSIRSDVVRRIELQQCLYARCDNEEGEFACCHYHDKLVNRVFTDEDDGKQYRVVFIEFNKKDFVETTISECQRGYKKKPSVFDPKVALKTVDVWVIVVYAICVTDIDMVNEPSRWLTANQPTVEGDLLRRMEADLFAPEDFDLSTMTIKSSRSSEVEVTEDSVHTDSISSKVSKVGGGGGSGAMPSTPSAKRSKLKEESEDEEDPGTPSDGQSLHAWAPAPGRRTSAQGRSSTDDAKLRTYIGAILSADGSEFTPEDGLSSIMWRALSRLPPNFCIGDLRCSILGVCDFSVYSKTDIDEAIYAVLNYDRTEHVAMKRNKRTDYINDLIESFINYATI